MMHLLHLFAQRAIRGLARSWTSRLSILTLAFGLGSGIAIFSLYDSLVLRPLPLPGADRLVKVAASYRAQGLEGEATLPGGLGPVEFGELQRSPSLLDGVVMQDVGHFKVETGQRSVSCLGVLCSQDYFQTLGVRPVVGRGFSAGDPEPGLVVSHAFWLRNLGGNASLGACRIQVHGVSFPVVGVAPPAFTGLVTGLEPSVWMPATAACAWEPWMRSSQNERSLVNTWCTYARLKPGVTPRQAEASLEGLRKFWADTNSGEVEGLGLSLEPLERVRARDWSHFLPHATALWVGAFAMLILSSLNVCNLQMAAWIEGRKDLSIRLALGASHLRLAGAMALQQGGIVLAGTLLALPLGWAGARGLAGFLPTSRYQLAYRVTLDWRILAFSGCLMILAVAILMAFALLWIRQDHAAECLRQGHGDKGAVAGWRRGLLGLQVALAFGILGCALTVQGGYSSAHSTPLGFQARQVQAFTFEAPRFLANEGKPQADPYHELWNRVLGRLGVVPGIEAVSGIVSEPLTQNDPRTSISAEGQPPVICKAYQVQPGFFQCLGAPLVGHDFDASTTKDSPRVAVVNQDLAARLFPGQTAVGRAVTYRGRPCRIVGVVGDIRFDGPLGAGGPKVFVCAAQGRVFALTVLVRSQDSPDRIRARVETEVQRIEPRLALYRAESLQAKVDRILQPQRLATVLLGTLALVAAMLSITGIFGLQGFLMAQRKKEACLRLFLGSSPGGVIRLFLRGTLVPALAGVGAGLGFLFAGRAVFEKLLFGLGPVDPWRLLALAGALLACSFFAALAPLLRILKLELGPALKVE